jgi:hypothetical protein
MPGLRCRKFLNKRYLDAERTARRGSIAKRLRETIIAFGESGAGAREGWLHPETTGFRERLAELIQQRRDPGLKSSRRAGQTSLS